MKKYLPKKVITRLWFYLTRFIVGVIYILKGQKEELYALIDGIKIREENIVKGVLNNDW